MAIKAKKSAILGLFVTFSVCGGKKRMENQHSHCWERAFSYLYEDQEMKFTATAKEKLCSSNLWEKLITTLRNDWRNCCGSAKYNLGKNMKAVRWYACGFSFICRHLIVNDSVDVNA